ncbi:M48 family metalloprotease [Pseudodesulfovibrio sediminis]|uniref:Peptidase M48 domain-containing protein n=1 Tax=Pseudodesulfovibrio sediminis TaxID=2810563 RepID=A0ABM7P4S0_9BACT|nr:M48 family metalloprotease [Pseudodesulfovibrio sediminis]BCS88618.1 hypothetical protein PSDVSF_18600 [Pseudodesulfovibrio sediminis]
MERLHIIRKWSRREFIKAGGMAGLAVALGGCAKNPVTGQSQFMLVSEEEEIQMDKKASPQQLSNDYGRTQDAALNTYVAGIGKRLSDTSHRPQMPYSFNPVNANYVNAYAFPGGTVACTRGIMLQIDNEAELAALLGHEIGHVNARHTASRMSSQTVIGTLAGIGGAVVGAKYGGGWGALAGGIGGLGAGLLLASYSRDDERQADGLGLEYMTNAKYNPDGMVGLMEMLNTQHEREPSALEVMFATHPMSSERLTNARKAIKERYIGAKEYKVYHERYMDNTAELRKLGPAIEDMQEAEKFGSKKKYAEAEEKMGQALQKAPHDYTALLLMSKVLIAQEKYDQALPYAMEAKRVYPEEAQANQVSGVLLVNAKKFTQAYDSFEAYGKAMPGNPYGLFFQGYSLEGMGKRDEAARKYYQFLQKVRSGNQAKHAYRRLVEWGYIKSEFRPSTEEFKVLA